MTDTTRESVDRWKANIIHDGSRFLDGVSKSAKGGFVPFDDYAALLTRAEAAEAERDALQSKLDAQGRELNRVKYGEPDFSWAIHKAAMADLRAKLAVAAEALTVLMDLNDNGGPFGGEMYHDRVDRAWDNARAALTTLTADTLPDPRIEGWNAAIEAAARLIRQYAVEKGNTKTPQGRTAIFYARKVSSIPYTPKEGKDDA